MDITESKVRAIVERVVARLAEEERAGNPGNPGSGGAPSSALSPPPSSLPSLTGKEIGVFDAVEEAVDASTAAFQQLEDMTLATRDRIIASVRAACREKVEVLSKMAVEETGLGRWDDKIKKNLLAIDKTPGTEDLAPRVVTGDNGLTLYERAPWGVVASITPCTNPTETIISNGIGILAAGNGMVFCPHPLARNVSNYLIGAMNEAAVRAGGPANLFCTLRSPTIQQAQDLMKHKAVKLLVVTGGPDVVRTAMGMGKPVIGAGPGNPPVVVDETADIEKAGRDVVRGASLDNNIICTDEKEVFVVASVADKLKRAMADSGGHEIKSYHVKQLEKLVLTENRGPRRHSFINRNLVGKDAAFYLDAIGVNAPPSTRLVFCEVEEDHPFVWTELLMPILPVVRVPDVDYAIRIAKEAEHGFRHTSVMHSNRLDKLSKMAREIDTSLFIKNGPAFAGIGLEGEGHASFTIASPTGHGVTSAKNFTRERKCVLVEYFRIV